VRECLIAWLIGLLVLCPQLCGGGVSDHSARHHDAGHTQDAPAHCPGDADDCICQGAVQVDQIRVLDADLLGTAGLFDSLVPPSRNPVDPQRAAGPPTGLAHWGSPLAIRAFLQNFRC